MLLFENLLTFEWRVAYTCIATIFINLPFGYLRGKTNKFSIWWFITIHAPIPMVIMIRKFHDLSLTWTLAPFLLGSFFLGQYLGRKIIPRIKKNVNKDRLGINKNKT